jgi:hypothetical protein
MRSRVLRSLLIGLALVATLALAGCGHKEEIRLTAETEGPYIDLGPVKYQVQMSRELNPADPEDRYYLKGLPEGTSKLSPEQVWFGVWMRAENESDAPAAAVRDFEITDSQEKVYRPVPLDPNANPFVYVPGTIQPGELIPAADTPPSDGPIQGSLLLFRLDLASYQNRPLELHMRSPQNPDETATISLDL